MGAGGFVFETTSTHQRVPLAALFAEKKKQFRDALVGAGGLLLKPPAPTSAPPWRLSFWKKETIGALATLACRATPSPRVSVP